MNVGFGKCAMLLVLAVLFATLCFPGASGADLVLPGYDLLETSPGTTFGGVAFHGVPLGTFDFGGTIGVKNVGNTDTIDRRLAPAVPTTSIPVQMLALQLESTVPTNFGLGVDFYFMTLQSERGGPVTTGMMTVFGSSFDSFFDVFFDIRKGSLNGPIAVSDNLRATSQGVPWAHDPVPGELLIDGVNHLLNGLDTSNDFQPIGTFSETMPTGAQHVVHTTLVSNTVPEPTTLILLGAGLAGVTAWRQRRR